MKKHHRPQRNERPTPPRRRPALMPLLSLLWILPAAAAGAGTADAPARDQARDPQRLCIGSGRGEVTLEVDGQQISVTHRDGERTTTTVVDMDQVATLVGDALGEAMAAMQDLQLQVRVGQDNRVNIQTSDREVEVDLDQIMAQVAAAVQSGMQGIDTATWAAQLDAGAAAGGGDQAQLQRELADLQDEMRALRKELQRLRDQAPPPRDR